MTIIFLAFLATPLLAARATKQDIRMYYDDVLTLDLTEELDYRESLNDLTVTYDKEKLEAILPLPSSLEAATVGEKPLNTLEIKQVVDIYSRDKIVYLFYQKVDDSYAAVSLTPQALNSKISFEATSFMMESRYYKCGGFTAVNNFGFTFCRDTTNSQIIFCSKHINSEEGPECPYITGSYATTEEDFTNARPQILSHTEEGVEIHVLFVANSNSDLHNKIFVVKRRAAKIVELPIDTSIENIRITSYDKDKLQLNLLVNVVSKTNNDLYSVSIVDGILDKESWQPVKLQIQTFYHCNRKTVMIEKPDRNYKIYINPPDGSIKVVPLTGVSKIFQGSISSQFFIIPYTTTDSELRYFMYDFAAEAYYHMTDGKRLTGPVNTVIDFDQKSLFIVYESDLQQIRISTLTTFQNLFVNFRVKGESQTPLTLNIRGQAVETYNLETLKFDILESEDFPTIVSRLEESKYVKILLRGNVVAMNTDDKLMNFSVVSLKNAVEYFNICNPRTMMASDNYLVFFCDGGVILSFDEFTIENNELLPLKNFFYPPSSLSPKFDRIKDVRILYDNFLIVLMEDNEIAVISLKQMKRDRRYKVLTSTELKTNYSSCKFNNQGLMCLMGNEYAFLYMDLDEKLEVISFLKFSQQQEEVVGNVIFNSYFDRGYFVVLRRDKTTKQLEFVGYNSHMMHMYIDRFPFPLGDNPIVHQISHEAYVFVTQAEGTLQMFAVVDKSLLIMPTTQYLKDFGRLLQITTINKKNIFAVLYETKDGKLRGAVYRATFEVTRRIVSEFAVDSEKCDKYHFKIRQILRNTSIVYFICLSSKKWDIKMWSVEPDGPLLRYQTNTAIERYNINGFSFSLNLVVPEYQMSKKRFTIQNIYLKLQGENTKYGYIEPDFVQLAGDLKRVRIEGTDSVKSVSRARELKRTELMTDTSLRVTDTRVAAHYFGEEAVTTFKNFMSTKGSIIRFQYESCQVAETVYSVDDPKPFFLCRSEKTFKYSLTDNDKLTVELSDTEVESTLEVAEIYLIDMRQRIKLFFQYRGTKVFKMLTFAVVDQVALKLMDHKTFSVDDYSTDGLTIQNYFLSYDPNGSRVTMFFVPHLADFILVKEASTEDNNYALEFEKINLYKASKMKMHEKIIYASDFAPGEGSTLFFAAGKVYISVFELKREKDKWNVELLQQLHNPMGNDVGEVQLYGSKTHFFLIQDHSVADVNIIGWKLEDSSVVQVIGQPEIGLDSYFVQGFAFRPNEDGSISTSLYLLAYPSEALAFTTLSEIQFNIGKVAVAVSKRIKDSQKVRVVAQYMDGSEESQEVLLSLHSKPFSYLKYFLIWLFLLGVLALTGYFALKMMRENKLANRESESTAALN